MDNHETTLNLSHMVRPAIEHGPDGGAGPCLILLHGRGADEADLMGLEGALDPRLTIVSPRAPFRLGPGYAWYLMGADGEADDESFMTSVQELRTFLEGLPEAYDIDPSRLYLFGFSQGAVLSSALAMLIPGAITGIIMHSGYISTHHAGLDLPADGLKDKPFFLAHGKYDDVIPVTWGRDALEYLEAAGAHVIYKEYPIGHSISEESLYDAGEWLTAHLDFITRTD
ncbi:MAG: alpha/beta hydrolase [Chloroflexota bacterium]